LFSSLELTNVATFCCPPQNAVLQPWVRPGDVLIDKDNKLTVVYMRRQHLLQARITALGMLGHRATTLCLIFPWETRNTFTLPVFWDTTPCRQESQLYQHRCDNLKYHVTNIPDYRPFSLFIIIIIIYYYHINCNWVVTRWQYTITHNNT
jgi:hypothetical protein